MSDVKISWGKPKIEVKKFGATGTRQTFATPVVDSTTLSVTKGTKLEAKIEGGTNEAVKYQANTYTLEFKVRQVDGRTDPIVEVDGIVADEYEVRVTPENINALGLQIDRAAVSVSTEYTAAEGIVKTYTFDVLQPTTGAQVKLQKITGA